LVTLNFTVSLLHKLHAVTVIITINDAISNSCFQCNLFQNVIYSCDDQAVISASLLQSSVMHMILQKSV